MKGLLYLLLLAFSRSVNAQVAINTDGSLPDISALLDVKSTVKGLLLPRMTLDPAGINFLKLTNIGKIEIRKFIKN